VKLEQFYDKAYTWVITEGPKILLGLVVLFVGIWLIRILSKWLTRGMQKRELDPSLKMFLLSLIVIAMRVMLVLAVMQIMGIEMTIFAAVIGSFGVAAGLALSGTLQNFASGVLILLLKPFQVNDHIITQGQAGIVTSIQIFYTIITTADNKTIIVPNSKLSNEIIVNITRMGKRRLDVEMKFNYGVDFDVIKDIALSTIEKDGNPQKNTKKRVGISTLEADGYKVMINLWVSANAFDETKYQFQEKLLYNLKQAGIKLPGME
jgi:small conductance mechanosensitive channel